VQKYNLFAIKIAYFQKVFQLQFLFQKRRAGEAKEWRSHFLAGVLVVK
jgi:hypothetical protein